MFSSLTQSILKDFMDIIMITLYEASKLCKAFYIYYFKSLERIFKVNLVFLTFGSKTEEFWGRMDTCVYTVESLCCSPESITILLMGYTPAHNIKLKTNKQRKYSEYDQAWFSLDKRIS